MMKIPATLLILSCVLHVKEVLGVLHEDLWLLGCSDTDGEVMYGVDGDVKWYADFTKGKAVMAQPDFADPFTVGEGAYEGAVGRLEGCRANLKVVRTAMKEMTLEPKAPDSVLFTKHHVEVGVANILICHVTGFYPAPVHVTWTRNNLNLTSDITTTVPYLKDDGTFYQFSRVKITPEQGDIYSCTVTHQSLADPETRMWDVDHHIPAPPSVGPDVFCAVGLTLGLLGVAMGTFFLIKGNECH